MKNLLVRREKIVNLYKALGFKLVDKWDDVRLQSKIPQLPKLVTGKEKLKPKKKELLKTILKVLKKKGKVLIKEVQVAKKASAKAEKKVKAKKGKKKKATSEPAGKDAFGSRIGTSRAKVNKALSKNSRTLAEIKTKAGLKTSNTFGEHLQSLIDGKLVKKVDNKYALTVKGAKVRKGS